MLASASAAVIAIAVFSSAAQAAQVTSTEADQCAKLPTAAEQQACVAAQAADQRGAVESGEAATVAPSEAAEQAAETEGTIVVTGSRLRRSPFNSPDPLTVIDPQVAIQEGDVETAEVLQSTPVASGSTQITSFLSSNFVFNGGPGVQTLSLRGLGAERTLVLLDGRRAGPAGVRGAVAAFDLNVLPTSIVRSIEIVKTGASSVYGSDAIAGVVNILTKRDTDGIELRAFGSLPEESGGETYDLSATWGKEFSRGHILVSGSYFRRNELERRDRDFLGCTIDYAFNPAGDRVDLLDPRTGEPYCGGDAFGNAIALSNFSTAFGAGSNLGVPPGAQFAISLIQFNTPGSQTDVYGFPIQPAANAFQFRAPAGFYGVNVNSNSTGILNLFNQSELQQGSSVIPKTTRYTAFVSGSYEITDNIELFTDLLYNRRETIIDSARQFFPQQFTASGPLPAFFCPSTTFFGSPNPYCRTTDAGDPFNVGFSGAQVLTPVIIVPFNTDQQVDYYRGVVGARGEVSFLPNRPWRWDVWTQYSRSDGTYSTDVIFQDAADALTMRTRSCQGLNTEIRGVPCVDINLTDPRVLAGDFTDAERAFLFGRDTGNTRYTQLTGEATLSGDVVDLWAGPLQASVGVHARRDQIKDVPGETTQIGNSWQLTRSGVTAGHTETLEAFGEVSVPLFQDRPIVGSMEVSAAARVTNYRAERKSDGLTDKDNGNWTYKLGVNWPINDIVRLRGTYGTSYRAPALFEQFLADETGFQGQTAIDPCVNYAVALANGAITQNIADACAAQGVPSDYNAGGTSSAVVARGGGIGVLDPETSRALTASVILTPPPVWSGSRISFAVDYFEIKVKGEITPLGAANIVRSCLDSDTFPNDQYCSLFTRINDPLNTRDNQIIEVRNPYVNINKQVNRGLDFTLRFSQEMGSWGNFSFLGQATYQIEDRVQLFENNPLNPGGNSRINGNNNGEAGEPKWIGDFNFTWAKKPFTLVYGIDYIGATSDRYDARRINGDDLCAVNAFRGTICPDFRLERTFYHSASINFDLLERYNLTLGVSNIFDTPPPRISRLNSGSGGNIGDGVALLGSQYDYLGRRFFASVTAKF
ncbi:MAG TPA: TonB-dependent receptor [Sphingomicrobium sp.]|nr:TonB-dependent receptor [Sphingomicrobium sp.]